ncbi:MAG: TlpA family protein disulfide reductase [candidate division NC10 bacterium]|nr:TlpA family protein disulfide reductase [candidate division NC10 bacterium]
MHSGRLVSSVGLLRLLLVFAVGGPLLTRPPSAEGVAEEGARLPILTLSEPADAPDFTLDGPSGSRVRLRDFRGRVVFLNFWATWCIPCRTEMPAMERLYQDLHHKGLVVLAVNFQDDAEAVRSFREEFRLTIPMALDRKGTAASAYRVRGLPASFVLDRKGRIVSRSLGAGAWDSQDVKAYFRHLLAE